MALVTEDGTGQATAESYISVADADTYHASFGRADWIGAPTIKEEALRVATQFLDTKFIGRWRGQRLTQAQALAWPRSNASDADGWYVESNVVPIAIERATAELALYALTEDLMPPITAPVGSLKFSAIRVGPIEERNAYHSASQEKFYALALRLVQGLIIPGGEIRRG